MSSLSEDLIRIIRDKIEDLERRQEKIESYYREARREGNFEYQKRLAAEMSNIEFAMLSFLDVDGQIAVKMKEWVKVPGKKEERPEWKTIKSRDSRLN